MHHLNKDTLLIGLIIVTTSVALFETWIAWAARIRVDRLIAQLNERNARIKLLTTELEESLATLTALYGEFNRLEDQRISVVEGISKTELVRAGSNHGNAE